MADFRSFLPERTIEDMIAERVRLTIGGEVYILPAKVVEDNEVWLSGLNGDFRGLMEALSKSGDDYSVVVGLLTRDPDWLIDHLISYDHTGVLPDKAVIRKSLTPIKLLMAVAEVWRAANPLVDIALAAMTMDTLLALTAPTPTALPPTGSSRRNTNGRRATSAKA
jgi:hypothetical protein